MQKGRGPTLHLSSRSARQYSDPQCQVGVSRVGSATQAAAVAAAQHNVTAQEHLLKQLRQNRNYASVVAPFDGVITQRNVDVGSLVQGNAASGTFMFEIMQNDMTRVWVYVPQDAAFGVAPRIDAVMRVPELPDREFRGAVARIADAQQSGTRTLLTEIDLPNPDGALRSGVYCIVELKIPRRTPSFVLPADAIIFDHNGMQVAVVSDGKAEMRKVIRKQCALPAIRSLNEEQALATLAALAQISTVCRSFLPPAHCSVFTRLVAPRVA